MKFSVSVTLILLFPCVLCHMPTLYEFCSHVVANGNASLARCDSSQCQGRPGKRGIDGPRGLPGIQGERGEPGTAEHLEERIKKLEDSFLMNKRVMAKTNPEICYMGVKNRHIIPDSQITASSIYDNRHQAYYGRLDNLDRSGGKYEVWAAKRNTIGEWHQVDFMAPKPIGGIVTQGYEDADQWVRSFKISYGNSTSAMISIQENGSDKIFTGNNDRTKVTNMFPNVIICRYIRVYPQTWKTHMVMRLEYIDGMCHGLL
uniref:lactadherin-like n=1 Tax=Styela clava TaxID=7725 RepID=UPI00193AC7E8|nr:lactadherin-like [Styela clava]